MRTFQLKIKFAFALMSGLMVSSLASAGAGVQAHTTNFKFCNNGTRTAHYAIAYHGADSDATGLTTEGYLTLNSGACSTFTRDVTADGYYVYAVDDVFIRQAQWTGDIGLCVSAMGGQNGFRYPNADRMPCNGLDDMHVGFRAVQSFDKGLVTDIIDDQSRTLARKTLTICNDTPEMLQLAAAAPSFAEGVEWMVRGWYNIDSGVCMTTLATDGDTVYYYADSKNQQFAGEDPICTVDKGNFIFTHPAGMTCTDSGQKAYGFLPVMLPYPGVNLLILGADEQGQITSQVKPGL